MKLPNLLIVAGTGTKSGKTTMACRIIRQFSDFNVTAVKISPHFHQATPGLSLISQDDGYAIYEEKNQETAKDTSRMLRAGAAKVYFATVWDNRLAEVFEKIMKIIPEGIPVICESPALRNVTDPGLFIIMSSASTNIPQDTSKLEKLPHLSFELKSLESINSLPFGFEQGMWHSL